MGRGQIRNKVICYGLVMPLFHPVELGVKPLNAIGRSILRIVGREIIEPTWRELRYVVWRVIIEPTWRELRYVVYCRRSIKQLNVEVGRMLGAKVAVQSAVSRAGMQEKDISQDVKKWLEDVGVTYRDSNNLLKEAYAEMKVMNGWCPNPITRYWLGKKIVRMFDHVAELQEEMSFDKIADPAPPPRIGSIALSALNPEFSRRK